LHDPQGGVLNKEKSLSASRVGCLGVLFVSVGEDYLHDPQGGVLNKEKSLSASRVGCRGFCLRQWGRIIYMILGGSA